MGNNIAATNAAIVLALSSGAPPVAVINKACLDGLTIAIGNVLIGFA
jgi:hypothetical protein